MQCRYKLYWTWRYNTHNMLSIHWHISRSKKSLIITSYTSVSFTMKWMDDDVKWHTRLLFNSFHVWNVSEAKHLNINMQNIVFTRILSNVTTANFWTNQAVIESNNTGCAKCSHLVISLWSFPLKKWPGFQLALRQVGPWWSGLHYQTGLQGQTLSGF